MKISTFLVAAVGVVTQAVAAEWPLKFRGSEISCYDNGWSVNGNSPSIFEATAQFCNKYRGRNIDKEGYPPDEIVELKTPQGHPFKLWLYFWSHSQDSVIWDSDLCIKLYQDVIQGCEALKGYDVGRFMGGAARPGPTSWTAGIDCDNSSCPRFRKRFEKKRNTV
ncbi:hypothetical protein GX51_02716 [Blastomyces parvus]|uniref:Ecp2 effector protein domain-containing protein n=1 Tax=Blastomyces parvus TaxID=2060905 RepID=A0A2B7X9T4_9EURO|nr:hypothetical protein GX51_02716 [Blastomyces parvus]